MSTFKKVISLVLCFVMLLGVALPAAVAAEDASATTETSHTGSESVIDSIESLNKLGKDYVYFGLEFYEKDADGEYTITDHYVQPGDTLRAEFYMKSTLWFGAGSIYLTFDRNFFDITNGEELTYKDSYDPAYTGYPTEGYPANLTGDVNTSHPGVAANGVTFTYATKWARNTPGFTEKSTTNFHNIPLAETDEWDLWYISMKRDGSGKEATAFDSDEYFFSFEVTVREFMPDGTTELEDGTTGFVTVDKRVYSITDQGATTKRVGYVSTIQAGGQNSSAKRMHQQTDYTIDEFFVDDCNHTFTIGEPANDGGDEGGEVEPPKSVIDSIEDLNKLGKHYVYFGMDFYEKSEDGEYALTDHYVQPGDTLRAEFYMKSTLWFGAGSIYLTFDRNFFDITNGETITYKDSYDPAYTGYPTEGYPANLTGDVNTSHPGVAANGVTFTYATKWARNTPGFTEKAATNFHNIPLAETDEWDLWYISMKRDGSGKEATAFDSDEYFFSFEVTVREFMPDGTTKLADGTTGFVTVDKRVYSITDQGATTKRVGYVSTIQAGGQNSSAKRMHQQTDYTINEFFVEDCNHTFTIGEPQSTGGNSYTITFVESDGTETAVKAKENTEVAVPAAVENELGWANVATGKIVDTVVSGQTITATKNATYKRILSTDKFDVTINLDGGTIDGESTLVVKAGYGEEVDLTQYAPEKEGYNPVWEPATVTVESIKGATAKVKWEAKTYQASFYLNKEDAEAYQVVDVKYMTNLSAPTVSKEGYSFAGWYNAETDELASKTPSLGQYKLLDNSSYYAKWSVLPDSITFMVKDFVTGEWKEYSTVYGDGKGTVGTATSPLSVENLKNVKSRINVAEVYGWDGEVTFARGDKYTSMTFNPEYVQSEMIDAAVEFDGAKVIYIHAFPVFEIEFQLPVYDAETGAYTGEYTSETKTLKQNVFSGSIAYSKSTIVPATGYVFDKWVAEDGSVADYYDSGANYVFNVSTEKGAKIVVKGEFKLEEYELRFNIGTSTGDTVTPVGVNNIGDILDPATAEYIYATGSSKGQATTLPVIGVTGDAQETVVHGKEGYKLVGWYITNENELIEIDGFEITPELAAKASVASDGTKFILIKSVWEAQNYDAEFYYWAEGSTLENPIYTTEPIVISAPVGTGRDAIVKMMSDADLALLDASVPEGVKRSTGWRNEDGSTAAGPLPVGGAKYYAIYDSVSIAVYVDWNSKEDDSDWYEVTGQNVRYGDDTMRGEYNSVDRGVYHYVTAGLSITDLERPSIYHEIVGWKVYHVKDASTYKDSSTWIEGTNDEGTSIARDTLIYQAQWKLQKDFFFRVYDTSGSLSMGLGKDFKMYYWKDSRVVDKDRAEILTDESMIIFLFVPKLENFSWDGFFSIEMWQNVSLRFDPFYLPKSMFTPEAIGGLFKALFTAIGTLIKGTD